MLGVLEARVGWVVQHLYPQDILGTKAPDVRFRSLYIVNKDLYLLPRSGRDIATRSDIELRNHHVGKQVDSIRRVFPCVLVGHVLNAVVY